MPTTDPVDQAVSALSDRFLAMYRRRHPQEAARLEAVYTVQQHQGTWWLKKGGRLAEPFGSEEAAKEGRLAAILGDLNQYDLSQRAARGEL